MSTAEDSVVPSLDFWPQLARPLHALNGSLQLASKLLIARSDGQPDGLHQPRIQGLHTCCVKPVWHTEDFPAKRRQTSGEKALDWLRAIVEQAPNQELFLQELTAFLHSIRGRTAEAQILHHSKLWAGIGVVLVRQATIPQHESTLGRQNSHNTMLERIV